MIVNVKLNGGPLYQLASRGDLKKLLEGDPAENNPVDVYVRFRDDDPWQLRQLTFLRRGSILYVEPVEVRVPENAPEASYDEAPMVAIAEARKANYEAKRAAETEGTEVAA